MHTASSSARFALALEAIDGVGRVTAGRLLRHFATYEELLSYPREQVLTRIKGAPNAEALVRRLFDEEQMRARLAEADEAAQQLRQKRITLVCPRDEVWPAGLDDLPLGQRPVLLYAFGSLEALRASKVALLARPPLSEAPFERAQALVRRLLREGIAPATGAAHGFDVVVHKITGGGPDPAPSLLVAHCGMAVLPRPVRPVVSSAVRAGGLLLSPFPLRHGPFDHDDRLRALVLTALSDACCFVEPHPDTPEQSALEWALEADRPVFVLSDGEAPLPDAARRLASSADFEAVVSAAAERT